MKNENKNIIGSRVGRKKETKKGKKKQKKTPWFDSCSLVRVRVANKFYIFFFFLNFFFHSNFYVFEFYVLWQCIFMMTSVRSTLQVGQFLSISFFSLSFDDKSNLLLLFKCPQCIINLLSDSGFNDSRRHTIVFFIWSNTERERKRKSKYCLAKFFFPVSSLEIIKIMDTIHKDIRRIEGEG